MLSARKILGLAVTELGLTAVELSPGARGRTIAAAATVPFTAEVNLDAPDRLGQTLKQTLRSQGFSAARCHIGLAGNWLVGREKLLPAADAETIRSALSLATEREFASGAQDLAFDFVSAPVDKSIAAFLAAVPRKTVVSLSAMAKSAGLTVASIGSSAAALAKADRSPISGQGRWTICLLPHGVELVVQSGQWIKLLRFLPASMTPQAGLAERLGAELRRVLSLSPAAGTDSDIALCLWDMVGLPASVADALERILGRPLRRCDLLSNLDVAPSPTPQATALAQAVALAGIDAAPVLDFLHSRLAPPRQSRLGRKSVWAIAAGVLLAAGGAFLYLDAQAGQDEVNQLEVQKAGLKSRDEAAKALHENVTFADGWHGRRPRFLDCMLDIWQAFPEEGRVWATSVAIREDLQTLVIGKSASESAVMDVRDRLMTNPRLTEVKLLYTRQAGGTSRDVSFAISLRLRGES